MPVSPTPTAQPASTARPACTGSTPSAATPILASPKQTTSAPTWPHSGMRETTTGSAQPAQGPSHPLRPRDTPAQPFGIMILNGSRGVARSFDLTPNRIPGLPQQATATHAAARPRRRRHRVGEGRRSYTQWSTGAALLEGLKLRAPWLDRCATTDRPDATALLELRLSGRHAT